MRRKPRLDDFVQACDFDGAVLLVPRSVHPVELAGARHDHRRVVDLLRKTFVLVEWSHPHWTDRDGPGLVVQSRLP